MRYPPINPQLFINNRTNLAKLLLANSLAVVNANDILPTNADGTLPLYPNSDLFYLTGLEQDETVLLIYPNADDEKMREILFLRETSERLATWEGHKLTKEEAGVEIDPRPSVRAKRGRDRIPFPFFGFCCFKERAIDFSKRFRYLLDIAWWRCLIAIT